VRKTTR